VGISEADDETVLQSIYGIGGRTLNVLQKSGYKLTSDATVGDFKRATSSYKQMRLHMMDLGIEPGYAATKLRQLWARSAQLDDASSTPEEDKKMDDPETNAMLAPRVEEGDEPKGDPQLAIGTAESEDVPPLNALEQECVPDEAVAMGYVATAVDMAVIPDVTLPLAPSDKEIAAISEPTVEANSEVSSLPAVAAGGGVYAGMAAVTDIEPTTHADELEDAVACVGQQPQQKANQMGDLGEDGKGHMQNIHGNVRPPASSTGAFKSVAFAQPASTASSSAAAVESPEEQKKQRDADSLVGGTQHPFRQASLFRNHDSRLARSSVLMLRGQRKRKQIEAASAAREVRTRDPSFFLTNPYTQGVDSIAMPIQSMTNPLSRDNMTTEYQMSGHSL